MNLEPSANTKAVLLLTAPLLTGPGSPKAPLLTPREYRDVALWLQSFGGEPANLLLGESQLAGGSVVPIDPDRLKSLLDRGFQLAQALERWSARAIWVVGRADPGYPTRVKERLKANAPALLFCCGEQQIASGPALAIVGSRNAGKEVLEFTGKVAADAAREGKVVVSGGARGVDRAAMDGAIDAGGRVIGVLAGDLERASMNRTQRNLIVERRLLIVSPFDPLARFHVGHAMHRNKLIYAMADAGLVTDTAMGEGGTWAGAVEQLSKYRTPVYVRSEGAPSPGLEALRRKGALPWDGNDLNRPPPGTTTRPVTEVGASPPADLLTGTADTVGEIGPEASTSGGAPDSSPGHACAATGTDCSENLYQTVRKLTVLICANPMSRDAIAEALGVPKSAADHWLKRLVAERVLEKQSRPIRYVARQRDLLV